MSYCKLEFTKPNLVGLRVAIGRFLHSSNWSIYKVINFTKKSENIAFKVKVINDDGVYWHTPYLSICTSCLQRLCERYWEPAHSETNGRRKKEM